MNKKKRLGHYGLFIFTGLLLVYVIYIGVINLFRYNSFKMEYQKKMVTYNEALQKNRDYKLALAGMKTQDYWELQAKERLGYVKSGEVLYRIVPGKVQ